MVISQPIILALIICCFGYCQTLNILPPIIAHSMSKRLLNTENPHIEDVCDKYADIPDLIMLALGSVYWNPPQEALQEVVPELTKPATHRYGSILGEPSLRDHLMQLLSQPPCMMDMSNLDVIVTAGANQGFMNVALAVLDEGDDVIILAPYYFCHKVACQLCDAKIHISPFNKDTLGPDWATLETMVASIRPKMIVITSPNNPSGYVWSSSELQRVVQLSKSVDAWLAVDQTYHEFLFDGAQHTYPCSTKHNYNKIMQLFSFSKLFAMPGYRVGYLVYPKELASHMRKIQDCVPTHASIFSQALALKCLQLYYPIHDAATPPPPPPPTTTTTTTTTTNTRSSTTTSASSSASSSATSSMIDALPPSYSPFQSQWAKDNVGSLEAARAALFPILAQLGTVRTSGAFYFLVPVPEHVAEAEAVEVLARQFGVLLMPGGCFGAPGHLRLSYGSLAPETLSRAVDRMERGVAHLLTLSEERALPVPAASTIGTTGSI